jgi:peroxiredoxin family protein
METQQDKAAFICVKDTIDGAYPSLPDGVMGAIPGMSTIATSMMKKKIDKANIPSLGELQEMAQLEGVELIACKMTVDMMEIDETKLVEDVVVWTAEDFLKFARDCKICLFT